MAAMFAAAVTDCGNNNNAEISVSSDSKTKTAIVSEEKDTADNGVYYSTEVAGIIPKIEPGNEALIEELDRGEWICVIKDNNGQMRLVGSSETPLRFDSGKDTGVSFTSRNNVKFAFKGKCATPSVVIED